MFPSDSEEQSLLSPDEETLLRSITRSKVWRLIQDALIKAREDLFAGTSTVHGLSGQPTTNEALWANRGATLLVQHLLQEGPLFVIWSKRSMDAQAEEKAARKATVGMPEREYVPSGIKTDAPDFDI